MARPKGDTARADGHAGAERPHCAKVKSPTELVHSIRDKGSAYIQGELELGTRGNATAKLQGELKLCSRDNAKAKLHGDLELSIRDNTQAKHPEDMEPWDHEHSPRPISRGSCS